REARALCLELLLHSKGDEEVMKAFVERRGLMFIKGWLAEETKSINMMKLLLTVAKVLPVTYSSLMQSDAGKALKALNKHADSGIRKQAKAVISHWRTALVSDKGEIAKHRKQLDDLHDKLKAKQDAEKKAKAEAADAEKRRRDLARAQSRPPNGLAGRGPGGRGRRPAAAGSGTPAGRGTGEGDRGGAAAAGRGGAAAAGRGGAAAGSGGILKVTAVPTAATAGGQDGTAAGGAAATDGEGASAAAVGGPEGESAGTEGESAAAAAAAATAASAPAASGAASIGSGPPPIVSLDEMARAESEEKKRLRKAKPAGKKVGWADRAGRTLQVVKEFHSEDAATAVSETPQESDSVVAATMASHHAGHRHWAERVKREREMERKLYGKNGGRSKSKSDHGRASAGDEEEEEAGGVAGAEATAAAAATAAARKKRKPMVTTVPWRRPGPYEKGVVHEDVLQLEVESSEAESQGARTRAGLEQVYLSSGDIPSTPAEPDAASFLPV
ncbi:unnamed protein product, partial [Ectocarpus sp. 12 AP-2014]